MISLKVDIAVKKWSDCWALMMNTCC